jgi:hypothetical protein
LNDLTIVVNSSDGFEDCWHPFFTLFAKYWPACPYPLVLNTEKKRYQHAGLRITSSQVAAHDSRRLTWSECLMRCLDGISTPLVLYLQEDFFLEAAVRADLLERLVQPLRDGSADVVRVMECGGAGPWHATANPILWRVDQQSAYRISLQAVLWRKQTLRQHLRQHESPWQLEVFGSARARRLKSETVLCVNRDELHGPGKEVIPYTPTGVVKGKWEQFVPALFEREGIHMDYSQRGFYEPGQPGTKAPLLSRVSDRIRSLV